MHDARTTFEAWARGPAGYVDYQLSRYAPGSAMDYQDSITEGHWSIWKAAYRAALAATEPPAPRESHS